MSASKTLGPVARAVRSGDNREALEAVRDKLAHEIDLVGEDDRERLAPLTGRLLQVLRALDGIAEPEVNRKDELRRRREDRRAAAGAASVPEPPKRSVNSGAGSGGVGDVGGPGAAPVAGTGSRRRTS